MAEFDDQMDAWEQMMEARERGFIDAYDHGYHDAIAELERDAKRNPALKRWLKAMRKSGGTIRYTRGSRPGKGLAHCEDRHAQERNGAATQQ